MEDLRSKKTIQKETVKKSDLSFFLRIFKLVKTFLNDFNYRPWIK